MKRVLVAAVMVAAVGLIGFNAPARGATGYAAKMATVPAGFKFAPGTCESSNAGNGTFNIQVGDFITWKNCTQTDHTVTGEGFGSTDPISPQASVTHTFDSPGSFPYHCAIHPSMTGAVNVTGAPTTVATAPATTATPTPTTVKRSATTTSTTAPPATTTTVDIDGVFGLGPTSSTTPTTVDSTVTTRALGAGDDGGTSAGAVALLIVGLGAVGTAAALIIRNMRASAPPPPN